MKHTFIYSFLLVCLFTSLQTLGQSLIKGKVEIDGKPIAFANVLLLNAKDSSLVKGMVTSEEGAYIINYVKPGEYLMLASMVGYKKAYSSIFNLLPNGGDMELNTIKLEEDNKQLNEVTVQATKPLYEQQIDKLVVNVQSSITSAGSTALDVLERSPGIALDRQNNSLTMSGKEGVVVMINGKISRMPMAAVMQMLSGMNASNIEKIELITTPSASYDAEGNAGVINIVLKKNTDTGTNGSYSVTMGYGWYEKPGASLNINHRTRKLNIYGNGSFLWDHGWFQIYNYRRVANENEITQTATTTNRRSQTINYHPRLGFDYLLGANTTISGLFSGYNNRFEQFARNHTQIHVSDELATTIKIKDHEIYQWRNVMGNLNLHHIFHNKGEINIDADYLFYHHNNPHEYTNDYFFVKKGYQLQERMNNTKLTPIHIWVGKVDYSKNITEQTKLEAGVKGTFSKLKNDVHLERLISENWQTDNEFSQLVQMQEDVGAVFFNISHQFNSKTKLQTGLRWEFTKTDLATAQGENLLRRRYNNLFPSVFLSRELNKDNNLQFSYSRRITRPTYNDLAPFFTFLDPYTYIYGNTSLMPTLTNALQAAYQFKKSYMLTLQYSHDNNAINWLSSVDPKTNRQIIFKANLSSINTYAVVLNIPITITPWWQMQNNLIGSWQKSNTNYLGEKIAISARFGQLTSTQNFKLPHNYSIELSGFYKSKALFGIFEWQPIGALNIGIQKKFNKEKGTLALNVSDLFWTSQFKVSTYNPALNLDLRFRSKREPRVVRLTYSRNFGNQNVKTAKQRTTGSEEERKRAGGN